VALLTKIKTLVACQFNNSNERSVMRNFDLNEAPEDDDDKAKESIDSFLPFIGQCFLSLEEAFLFYELCKKSWI